MTCASRSCIRHLSAAGAQLFVMPSAFTVPTGRAHWETLLRARAIENLCYVSPPAQWGIHANGRETYGDSMIVDYWGRVLATAAARPRLRERRDRPCRAGGGAQELPRPEAPRAVIRRVSVPSIGSHDDRFPARDRRAGVARDVILRPRGLDDARLDQVFGEVLRHRVDFADLYFQLSHEESWALEDGIVKEGSASIEQGVGVRALAGEKTGFAYSDEIMLPALEEAARAARAIAGGQASARRAGLACAARDISCICRLIRPRRSSDDAEGCLARARRSRDPRASIRASCR